MYRLKLLAFLALAGLVGAVGTTRSPGQNTRPVPTGVQKSEKASSIWALNIDPVDGRMHVRARIWWSKKKEVHIECDHADLQTQKGVFQASGKVTVHGDNFEGRCERLHIMLHEDRVQLEGDAEVVLLKPAPAYSDKDAKSSPPNREHLLEVKGPQFSVRWPEMVGKEAVPAASQKLPLDPSLGVPPAPLPFFEKKNDKDK